MNCQFINVLNLAENVTDVCVHCAVCMLECVHACMRV